jgi:hypothetical protein
MTTEAETNDFQHNREVWAESQFWVHYMKIKG